MAALLQPPPEVYDLFDRVCLLDQGRVMYHGTRENVTKHFANLGYRIPERMDIADALQQITLPEGARFRTSGKHLTREEFSQEYKKNFKVVEGVVRGVRARSARSLVTSLKYHCITHEFE